jgi:hypothetical protein
MSNHWSPATHAARPRGSTVRTDEEGSYVAYHRVCNNCNVELTSRNRPSDRSLKCKPCARANRQAIYASPGFLTAKADPDKKRRNRTRIGSVVAVAAMPTQMVKRPATTSMINSVSAADRLAESHHTVSPERQAIHSLLTKFLLYPTLKNAKDNLLAGLVDYEIKERFRFL